MKNVMIALITLSFFSGLSSLAVNNNFKTQQNVDFGIFSGKIIDGSTKDAVAFANVILKASNGKTYNTVSDFHGKFSLEKIPVGIYKANVTISGYETLTKENVKIENKKTTFLEFKIYKKVVPMVIEDEESEVLSYDYKNRDKKGGSYRKDYMNAAPSGYASGGYNHQEYRHPSENHNTESYSAINENGFKDVMNDPLSTFSVDVDAASYSNMRRFLTNGQMPPKDAVRIEEMINYFEYDYPNPDKSQPFSITTELGDCPWNVSNKLIHIGLQGERIAMKDLPANNLVFLIDVSGSMNPANRLPLVKKSMTLLVNEMREEDKVAIVVYSGAAGLVLPSTSGAEKEKIINALENLQAGGSTAGGAGIKLAYKVAQENFIKKGNNRVIICTDGDFNVGASSDAEMQRLVESKRESGVFLTCLGYGMGNYKDSKMETLANKGNGNYAYIDNLLEAKKVLVNEVGATLLTIAKDVKIQVEFNPDVVSEYRLVGYENRLLNTEDFNDDKKDAGEIGAGHSVTALYEVTLKNNSDTKTSIDPLKYQSRNTKGKKDEILTVKFRYKAPDGDVSKLIEKSLNNSFTSFNELSKNFIWSASVASFGMILRDSEYRKEATYDKVLNWANAAKGKDENGYRAEFIRLVQLAKELDKTVLTEK